MSILLRRALVGLMAVLLVLAGVAAGLLGSGSGTAWLLSRVPGLAVASVQGNLLGGNLSAERIEVSAGSQRWTVQGLAWQDAQWSWRPHPGAWVGLNLVAARAGRIELATTDASTPAAQPASLRLPLALTLQDARVDELHIDGAPPVTQIAASLALGAGAGAMHRIDALAFAWDRAKVQASGQVASDAPFALEAQVSASSLADASPPWSARAQARGTLAALDLGAQLGSTAAAGAALNAQASLQPFAAWPLASLILTTRDLDLAALASSLPATRLSGSAQIETQGRDKPIGAHVTLANAVAGRWDQQRLPVTALEVDLAGQAGPQPRLGVQRFKLQLADGAGRIEASGQWQGAAAQLDLRLQAVRPALLDARAPALTLSGSTTLQLDGLPSPDGRGAATASQRLQAKLALDGTHDSRAGQAVHIAGQVRAERQGADWRIELDDVLATSGAARLRASMAARREGQQSWQLRSGGEFAGLDPALWWPAATAPAWRPGAQRLAGQWQADLNAGAAAASAKTQDARLLGWRGQAQLDLHDSLLAGVPLQGQIKLDGRAPGWGVDAELQAGANRATLRGQLAALAADDRWRLALDLPALAALQPLAELHPAAAALRDAGNAAMSGQLSGQVLTQGRWPALQVKAELSASALQGAGLRAGRMQLKAQAGPDVEAPLTLQLDAEQLQLGALLADSLQARIEGSLAEHRISLDAQSPLRPPAWADPLLGGRTSGSRLALHTQGQWQTDVPRAGLLPGRWRGQALQIEARDRAAAAGTSAWLSARDLRTQLLLGADGALQSASAEAGRVEFLGAALRWNQAGWQARTATRPAELSLDAQLEPLAVGPLLTRLLPGAGIGGNLMLAGHARVLGGANISADVVLERAGGDLNLTDDSGTQAFGLTDLRLALAAQDGTWHFTQALAGTNVGVLAGAQSLRLSPQAAWPPADTPLQGVLEWQVADLGAWAPFTPPGWRLSGTLRTGAAFAGSFGAPELIGEMSGQRLALRNILQGVDLRDGELALSLRGDVASIDRFVVKSGAGQLRVSGGANLGASPNAKLQIDAERFQVLGRIDRRIVASGNATLALAPRSLTLDGRVRVDEGLIDFSRSEAPSLDSDVRVRGGRNAAAAPAAPASAPPAEPAVEGAARTARMALQVDLGESLKMRGHGLDTQLRGNLALSAAAGKLSIVGKVRTEAGSYAAYGQKLDIERGQLTFTGPANNPGLDVLALRPNLDVRVGVEVGGSVQLPRIRLFSEPEMSDTEKLSWLVVGRAPDDLGGTDTALLQSAALALLAGEDNRLDKTLIGGLTLDDVSVRQTDSGDVKETVVSVGKQVTRRWYVGYERGVNSTTGTWQVIYRVAQRFTLRAQAGDDNALDAIWTWRWN